MSGFPTEEEQVQQFREWANSPEGVAFREELSVEELDALLYVRRLALSGRLVGRDGKPLGPAAIAMLESMTGTTGETT